MRYHEHGRPRLGAGRRAAAVTGRTLRWLTATTALLAAQLGLPGLLITLQTAAWHTINWADTLAQPINPPAVVLCLTGAGWLLWAWLLYATIRDITATIRGLTATRPRLPVPLHHAATTIAGIAATLIQPTTPTGLTHTGPTATATAVPALGGAELHNTVLVSAPVINVQAPTTQPVYEVRHGDWLGCIAQRFTGDFDQYQQLQRLNPDLITDADHIEPGMRLILPADAHDHGRQRHATGILIDNPTTPPTTRTDDGTHGEPSDPAPAYPPAPATPATNATPSTTATPPAPAPAVSAPAGTAAGSARATVATGTTVPADQGEHRPGTGVSLPGGWVSIPFASALVAAAAAVWLRRRHRYVPTPLNPATVNDADLQPLPPAVHRLRRAVRTAAPEPGHPPRPDTAARPEPPPVEPSGLDLAGLTDQIPTGGLGLTGPGAEPAARALLVATLSAGSPTDPDARGQIIIPADTLTTLLGAHTADVGTIPRLHVAANLTDALTQIEELLIQRRRTLQEHDANNLTDLRAADPYHPPMPPVLLLADPPPATLRSRLTTALHLGAALQINAVLLGAWPPGDTRTVQGDGHGTDTQRLAVLDVPTTLQLLQVLREAHTDTATSPAPAETATSIDLAAAPIAEDGTCTSQPTDELRPEEQPPATDDALTPVPVGPVPAAANSTDHNGHDATTPPAIQPAAPDTPVAAATRAPHAPNRSRRQPVRIQLLGEPAIFDRDGGPVPGLRHHARELLVYLTVHRNGADLSQIMEILWPDATVPRARERLSTEVSNLRGRIRQAAGDTAIQPVVNPGSRYHLDADLLDIDVWRLLDTLRRAAATTDPTARIAALREAVDTHTGTLADGHDYDWIEQPREQLRRHGIRARTTLAELLADTQPHTAAALTHAAATLDPINEDLARHAIRAHARIGDAAAIHAQLHQLRTALQDIDEEPSDETIALATQLQHEISDGRRDRGGPNGPASTSDR